MTSWFGIAPEVIVLAIIVWFFMPTFKRMWRRHQQKKLIREGQLRRAELRKLLYFKKMEVVRDDQTSAS